VCSGALPIIQILLAGGDITGILTTSTLGKFKGDLLLIHKESKIIILTLI